MENAAMNEHMSQQLKDQSLHVTRPRVGPVRTMTGRCQRSICSALDDPGRHFSQPHRRVADVPILRPGWICR